MPMLRTLLSAVLALALAVPVAAQGAPDVGRFATEFQKLFEFKDEKGLDKLLKASNDMPAAGLTFFQELRTELWSGKTELQPKIDMIKAAWLRVFENSPVLDKLERWLDSQDQRSFQAYRRVQSNLDRAWRFYNETVDKKDARRGFEQAVATLTEVAKQMESTGHKVDAAESWKFVAIALHRMPDRTLQDRKDLIFALEQYVALRQSWEWTQDPYFVLNQNTLKGAKQEIEQKAKDDDKRKGEGYAADVRGIDALVKPGVAEQVDAFAFAMLTGWEDELDFCQRGGPVPAMWWSAAFGQETKDVKLSGFRRTDLSVVRIGANKFGVSTMSSDQKRLQEVDAGNKGKPSQFFLDQEHKMPYALYVWLGTDRERLGEAEVNLAPADVNTNVYYRSAASWTAPVAGEALTFYDDNVSGWPMDADPFELPFAMHTLGYPVKNGEADEPRAKAPLLDSMRVGKGARVPFSEFVFAGGAWHYIRRVDGKVGVRPLNPDYLKLGKVKLVWSGPKPTAPIQLVIQGRGDFKSAVFDVATGKEIEVPGGEYSVIYGRIQQGKGARMQTATLYAGDSKSFLVEAGKTFELKMGAPFALDFDRGGATSNVEIDATRLRLKEASGCVIAELHGMSIAPDVLESKMADGKGAKTIAKFVRFTDGELVNKAVDKYRDIGMFVCCLPLPEKNKDGSLVLKVKVTAGAKVGLSMKKHPLFGKLDSAFK